MSRLMYEFFTRSGLMKIKNVTFSSRLVLLEAEKYGVDWKIIPGTEIISLTYKGKTQSYFHQVPSSTTSLANFICNNKKVTNNLLQQAGIRVPKGFRINNTQSDDYKKMVYDSLQKPIVVKPSSGMWGEDISLNVTTYEEYLEAVEFAFEFSGKKRSGADVEEMVLVERMFTGTEYRILTTREKVIGIVKRIPANVTGDGKKTIKELIQLKNKEPIRAAKEGTGSHSKIRADKKLIQNLSEQNLKLDSIVEKGKIIYLRKASNVSQGGEAIDFTDKVHESVKEIALRAIRAIPGLSFAGVDFMSKDITQPQTDKSYVIIEINDSPGFDMHDYPYVGKNRHTAREFLFLMFPELKKKTI